MLLFITLAVASVLFGQSRSVSYDNYCRDNPQMPTCVHRDLKLTTPPVVLDDKFKERWGKQASGSSGRVRKAQPQTTYVTAAPQTAGTRPPLRMTAEPVKLVKPEHVWHFVPPGTMLLMGVKLRVLRESEAWRSAMMELKSFIPTGDSRGIFDSLDDIDEVWMTSSAARLGEPIGVMRGRFDGPNWRRQIPASYRATTSIDTLLLGTTAGIAAAKRRIAAAAPAAIDITSTAQRMAADHDIWVVADGRELLAQGLKPAANAPAAMARLRGVALGVTLRDPLVAELTAESDSAEGATQIIDWIRKSAADTKEWQDLGGKMELRQDGAAVHMRIEMDSAKMQTLIAERTRRKSAPAPGKPGKVVIHGMEGGTRELPYGSTQQ